MNESGEHERQDTILRRLLDDRRFTEAQKARVISRVGELREAHPDMAWVATRYLQCVDSRGPSMFNAPDQQPLNGSAPVLRCGCGRDTRADKREAVGGRDVLMGSCGCGAKLTQFVPHPD